MTNIRQFCLSFILNYKGVSFDFDVSTITKENLYECIQVISEQLFILRPAREPYVQAFMIFGSNLHWKLQHETWYHTDLLVDAMAHSLEKMNFNPSINIFVRLKNLVNSVFEYLY